MRAGPQLGVAKAARAPPCTLPILGRRYVLTLLIIRFFFIEHLTNSNNNCIQYVRLLRWRTRFRRENAFLHSRDADFVTGVEVFEHDARVHGLEGREHVESGEVLCACAIRSAEELEQVFAIVSGNDLVKTLVRRVGLQGGERVRELGDEIFGVVARLRGFGGLLHLFWRLAQPGFAARAFARNGRRELEYRCLECVHLEAHVGGIFALFDRFEFQDGVQRGDVVAVRPFLEHHALVHLDDFCGRVVVFAGNQK